jgi:WD40 repeat protein
VHPTRDEFVTVGEDKTVRLWSIRSKEQTNGTGIFSLKTAKSQTAASCAFLGLDCVTGMADGTLCLCRTAATRRRFRRRIRARSRR